MAINILNAKKLLKDICNEYRQYDKYIMQGVDGEEAHALDVLGWVKRLNPQVSFVLQLAAIFHDIDRVITPKEGGGYKGDRKSKAYLQHKKEHAKRSANYIIPRLKNFGVGDEALRRIEFLILHHDDTGQEIEELKDPELNYLVAADTFAFFTSIWPKLLAAEGIVRLKDKVRFMIDKIPDPVRAQLYELQLEDDNVNTVKNEIIQEYYRFHNPDDRLYRFCPNCSTKLIGKNINGRNRPFCTKCGFIYWGNPRLCTSIILETNGKILLIRRKYPPLKDFWCLPGGVVEYHELVEESLKREAKEEIGLKVELTELIGIYQIDNDPRGVAQDIIYAGTIISGIEKLSDEHETTKYFFFNQLPKLIAYKHRQAINDYFVKKG